MSHISRIDISITSLSCLKKAINNLGGTFHEGKTEFNYYAGRKGQCVHAASFPNCSYELGIVKNKDNKSFGLEWDSYSQGGLSKLLGMQAEKLKQKYAYFMTKETAMKQGFSTTERILEDGSIKLTLSVN